jgi:glucose/arabinose dehydrogenase
MSAENNCFCQQADPNHRSQNGTATGAEQTGRVYGVLDSKNSGTSEGTVVLLYGQNNPNGIAWHNGSLYVAQMNRITRYDNADAHVISNMVRRASSLQNASPLQASQCNMLHSNSEH